MIVCAILKTPQALKSFWYILSKHDIMRSFNPRGYSSEPSQPCKYSFESFVKLPNAWSTLFTCRHFEDSLNFKLVYSLISPYMSSFLRPINLPMPFGIGLLTKNSQIWVPPMLRGCFIQSGFPWRPNMSAFEVSWDSSSSQLLHVSFSKTDICELSSPNAKLLLDLRGKSSKGSHSYILSTLIFDKILDHCGNLSTMTREKTHRALNQKAKTTLWYNVFDLIGWFPSFGVV